MSMSTATAALPAWPRRVGLLLAESFQVQWIFLVIPLLYLASNWVLLSAVEGYRPTPVLAVLTSLLTFALPIGLFALLVLRIIQFAFVIKPASPARLLLSEVRDLAARPSLAIVALPVFVAMVFFNKAMVELKPAIPSINPFEWDTTFMALDRALHFDTDPWLLLQPVLGFDVVTFVLNMAYNFWFVALFLAWFWFGFQRHVNELRTRFFLAYMLSWWIGGGLLAVIFSSAGPVYYGSLGLAPDPFATQLAYLHDVDSRLPLWALDTQKLLWDGYIGAKAALGISAFPSMHNASAVLFALAFWPVSRKIGWFFIAYAVVIFAGSVHLAWHYAIDGYAGALVAILSWWVAGPVARWHSGHASTRRFNEGLAAL